MAEYVSVGNLFTGARHAPRRWEPMEAPDFVPHQLVRIPQPGSGALGEAQSGLVMVHKIDADTDARMNALVDKIAALVSRRAMIGLILVAIIAFMLGRWLAQQQSSKPRKRKKAKG